MKAFSAIIVTAALLTTNTATGAQPPETIVLPAMMGKVTLDHKKHSRMNDNCTPCHTSPDGGAIETLDKEKAHQMCKTCHIEQQAGPTECRQCHQKP